MTRLENQTLATQFDAIVAWLSGPDAKAAAKAEVSRLRLPTHLSDDLLQETACGVWRTFAAGSEPYPDFDAAAYARRSLRNAALNMLRTEIVGPMADIEIGSGNGTLDPADEADLAEDIATALASAESEAAAQRTIFAQIGSDPSTGSAALTSLVLFLHPQVTPAPETPVPESGHTTDPAFWAGLWYAGRADCFAGRSGEDTPTIRRRRARAVQRIRRLLARSVPQAKRRADDS